MAKVPVHKELLQLKEADQNESAATAAGVAATGQTE